MLDPFDQGLRWLNDYFSTNLGNIYETQMWLSKLGTIIIQSETVATTDTTSIKIS